MISFDNKPTAICEFVLGDNVTRKNFTSFLILSFAVSKGSSLLHQLFFMWIEQRNGFPFKQTIKDFYTAGAFDCLSEEEQGKFFTAFKSIPKHSKEFDSSEFEDEIKDELKHCTKETRIVQYPKMHLYALILI